MSNDPHPFGDILNSAVKLLTPTMKPAGVNTFNASPVPASSLIDSDLTQIFEQSKELWQRKRVSPFDEAFPLTKLRPRKNGESPDATHLSHASTRDGDASWSGTANYSNFNDLLKRAEQLPTTTGASSYTLDSTRPYSQLALNEIDRCVDASIRRGRQESQSRQARARWTLSAEERELSMLGGAGRRRALEFEDDGLCATQPPVKRSNLALKPDGGGQMDFQAGLFAKNIDSHLALNCEASIRGAILEAVEEMDDREVTTLWEKVLSVCSRPLLIDDEESVAEMRLSRRWTQNVIEGATDYLQRQFKDYAAAVVKNHLAEARRGGRTDAISLVEAFLNVKMSAPWKRTQSDRENPPKWALVFYSMRVGDFTPARQLLVDNNMDNSHESLSAVLEALSARRIVEMECRQRLLQEWRAVAPTCQDAHQRAAYGALLGFDTPEVNASIEDWLWARLTTCKAHPHGTEVTFRRLQTAICVDCGEDYFVHHHGGGGTAKATGVHGGTGSFFLYFKALMLTGQLERAIYALWRGGYRTHSVHAAIHCYQLKLLRLADSIDDEILAVAQDNPVACKLNLPRLILRYVESEIEPYSLADAINYTFFLHKFELSNTDDGPEESIRNLFQSQLSRLLLRYGHIDDVLGRLDACGERLAGLIDKFYPAVDVSDTISHVAKDINAAGDVFKACQLYVLAERPKDALSLLNRKLAATAFPQSPPPKWEEDCRHALEMAAWLSQLYRSRGEVAPLVATLNQLISLHHFFQHYQRAEYETALKLIEGVKLIPLDADEIQAYVSAFAMVPPEVRQLLPDICVALMRCIVMLHDSAKSTHSTTSTPNCQSSEIQTRMRAYAKAVVLFCASVPYQFPVSTNSTLLQLQAQIA